MSNEKIIFMVLISTMLLYVTRFVILFFFEKLTTLPIGERYDLYDCYLLRVEGKDFRERIPNLV